MLLFFALNIIIVTYINSNELEKTSLLEKDLNNLLLKANNATEFINLLNYNKNTSEETKQKNFTTNELVQTNIPTKNLDETNQINYKEVKKELQQQNISNENFLSSSSISLIKKSVLEHKLRLLQKFNCINSNLSCSGHGECNTDKSDCICEPGFTTFQNPNEPSKESQKCNYERKKQLKAFLFELFLGFGAGHFYTERYTIAGLKLGAFIFGIFIICLFPITAKFLSEKLESDCLVLSVSCFYYLCSIGLAFWFIYDLIMFGMNKYLDGNQIQLQSWSRQQEMNITN